MKTIKYIIFFTKESPKFMDKSLIYLIFHEQFFKTMMYYIKIMKQWDRNSKKTTPLETYCILNRNLEV